MTRFLALLLLLGACSASPEGHGDTAPSDTNTNGHQEVDARPADEVISAEEARETDDAGLEGWVPDAVAEEVTPPDVTDVATNEVEPPEIVEDEFCSVYVTTIQECILHFPYELSVDPSSYRWSTTQSCCTCDYEDCGGPCQKASDCQGLCAVCYDNPRIPVCTHLDPGTPGYCTPTGAFLVGCVEYLDESGAPYGICVD